MTNRSVLFASAVIVSLVVPATVVGQRATPVGLRIKRVEDDHATRVQSPVAVFADTVQTERSAKPFVIVGALVGGIIGGVLAASYSFCEGNQPGFTCTSTDPATGAVIGAGVGAGVGLLVWLVARQRDNDGRVEP